MGQKRAIVTGGSSGIGRGIVYCLAEAGYDVAFSFQSRRESAERVLRELKGRFPDGRFFAFPAHMEESCGQRIFFRRRWGPWKDWSFW